MIVKIAQDKSWVVYDNFEKVRFEQTTIKEQEGVTPDATWFNTGKKSERCVLIIANKRSSVQGSCGLSFSILADSLVFLCNDEGKTIERIN